VPIVTVRVVPVAPTDDMPTVADPAPKILGPSPCDDEFAQHVAASAPPSARKPKPASASHPRRWGVEHPEAHFPFAPEVDAALDEDPWSKREISRAAAAVLVGISLALLSFVEFRGLLRHRSQQGAPAPAHAVVPPPAPTRPASPAPARTLVGSAGLSLLRGAPLPEGIPATRDDDEPTLVRADLSDTPSPALAAIDEPAREVEPVAAPAVIPDEPRIEARPLAAELAPTPAPVPAALVDTQARDEDRIRTTLAQWRDAYSQLDASAAREVWPSVDMRALERAFQALKSQDLSFDHCDFTVNGSRAQAACTGRASYVPRVGNTSPKTNAREWTFELTRSDDRWTIATATARSS
jgi:hypothetical protein